MEEWRIIEDFDWYEISSLGRVRSIDRIYTDSWGRIYHKKGQLLKLVTQVDRTGYPQVMVGIWYKGKTYRLLVSRLVAKAFIPNPQNLPMVNHLDEDSTNNKISNLEWCDAKYNANYGTAIERRSAKKRKAINVYDSDHNYIETLPSGVDASNKYAISRGSISRSCHTGSPVKNLYFEFA